MVNVHLLGVLISWDLRWVALVRAWSSELRFASRDGHCGRRLNDDIRLLDTLAASKPRSQ